MPMFFFPITFGSGGVAPATPSVEQWVHPKYSRPLPAKLSFADGGIFVGRRRNDTDFTRDDFPKE